jgi:hypothetical protein
MMTGPQIVIIPVDALDQDRIARLARTGWFTVCYLASSYSRYTDLHGHLPPGWSMPRPGFELNAVAERLRDVVINIDAQAQPPTLSRLQWDATLLAERGPLVSTLTLNLARLVVFIERAGRPGRHLVVVDDVSFGLLLLREARRRQWEAGWLGPGRNLGLWYRAIALRELLGRSVDGARRRVSVVRRFAVRKAQLAWQRRRNALRLDEMRKADVLLVVWGRADTFPKIGPVVQEFNFGRLPALLREAGFRVGYLVYPLTYVSRFETIAANALAAQEPAALIEDFIPWWAIIPAALRGLAFPRQVGRLSVLGIDATAVLRLEAGRDRHLSVSATATLLSYVGRGLARCGIRPGYALHLYESQPWEKMLAFGLRRHLPSARIVGVQHTPFAWNYLSFFPSRRSIAQGALPDLLLMSGEGYARWFRDAGISSARIAVLGALRFEPVALAVAPRGHAVLCSTSIELEEAIELATKAAVALEGLGVPLIINFHPVTDEAFRASVRDSVRKAIGFAADYVTFSPAPMRDLLEQSGIVLYMSSAACFEAAAAGRATVYLTRDLALDYDKLPNEMAKRCSSREALREILRSHFDTTAHFSHSDADLTHWLAPVVDANTLRRLLTSPCDASASTRRAEGHHQAGLDLEAATGVEG